MNLKSAFVLLVSLLTLGLAEAQTIDIENIPRPLFRDPVHDGAADPNLIWNDDTKEWWLFYTQRRANVDTQGTAWVYGSDIGIGISSDNGKTWRYFGIAEGLNVEPGHNTFWAPCVRKFGNVYHMFVTYVRGIQFDWRGDGIIAHYTSKNLWKWKFEGFVPVEKNVIDPTVHELPDGTYGLWYTYNGDTYFASSSNLKKWIPAGKPAVTGINHEAPIVFQMDGFYWMITDPRGDYNGLAVYRSDDASVWTRMPDLMLGGHADVAVCGDKAYIVYFRHFEKNGHSRASAIYMSELKVSNGNLVVSRY